MTEKEAIERLKVHKGWGFSDGTMKALNMAIKALEEIQQYKAIDTVEECREAAEKQKSKKIEYEGSSTQDGFTHYRMGKCPDCDRWYRNTDDIIYCSGCGQALDWSEEE